MTSRFLQQVGYKLPEFEAKLEKLPAENRIWLHAVSVGELNAARPLIMALQEQGHNLVISTTTVTGQTLAKKTYPDLPVFYFPLDFPWLVSKTLDQIKPEKILIMETEIWPSLMSKAQRKGIPVYLINGRMSDKSFKGYSRFSWFFRSVLGRYTKLLMQTESDKQRIIQLGAPSEKVSVMGNIKFDTAHDHSHNHVQHLRSVFNFMPGAQTIVFASTHAGEDELFLQLYQQLQPTFNELNVILAPRHPERVSNVSRLIEQMGMRCILRSELPMDLKPILPFSTEKKRVYLLDTIGELKAVYGFATLAIMGGSFVPVGGHNPLEPIQAGIPVLFGPHMENFRDIAQKVSDSRAGAQVQSIQNAYAAIHWLLSDMHSYEDMQIAGKQLIAENQGATQKVLEALNAKNHSCCSCSDHAVSV